MFPIEEEAAVVNFTAEVEGRTIKTEVRKKEEAKAAYDKAMQVFKLLSVIGSTCLLTDTFTFCVVCLVPISYVLANLNLGKHRIKNFRYALILTKM